MSRFSKLSTQYPALSTLWPYIAIIGLTLLFFYKLAFTGMILARGDMYAYFYPYWTVRSAAFMSGHIPLWSPDIFMGVPLLANSQIGVFYPPNWIVTPFDAPTAITISLLLHVAWAMIGAYRLARATLGLDQLPALLAAAVFGLGGYMGAKVENINQFQALSWMPWLFLLLHFAITTPTRRSILRFGLLLGIGIALQLLAGHPQTVFITAVGLGIYALSISALPFQWRSGWKPRSRTIIRVLIILACAGLIGIILAAPQLIPTLELSRASNRSGGLLPQQAMAFSLNPWILGRGLLPSYDGLIFGEYLTYVGIIAMGLAIVGIFASYPANQINDLDSPSPLLWRGGQGVRFPWIILLIVGFGLALGLYNPLYWTLASLPGFSFFRVPARWLALFALAAALLAGVGLQSLKIQRPRWWVFALIILLIAGLARASFFADVMAMDVIGPAEPTARTLIAWALAAVILLAGMWIAPRIQTKYLVSLLGILAMVELFAASRVLAYNEVAPPDTFNAQRFTISQLRAYAAQETPPGRILSISQALFDPGDIAALTARYHELGMSDLAIRIALVDTKLRELLAANLPLVWGVPSIDGFDGGLLPTGDYSAFTSLMLPPGQERSVDGRLREMLAQPECRGACIPDQRWLNLTNTRYLITDKTADLVKDGIFYDTTLTYLLNADSRVSSVPVDPEFTANAVDILYSTDACAPTLSCAPLLSNKPPTTVEPFGSFTLARWTFDDAQTWGFLSLGAPASQGMGLHAITLVDTRVDVFQQVTLPPWKRVLSSDIKLYENQNVLPRAFMTEEDGVVVAKDTESALAIIRDVNFNPSTMIVLQSQPDQNIFLGGNATLPQYLTRLDAPITSYSPERIEIQIENPGSSRFLLLTDTYYPGWTATVNGESKPIYKADVMFRAVQVPAGKSTVVFEYKPAWWPGILILGAAVWLLALLCGFALFRNPIKFTDKVSLE